MAIGKFTYNDIDGNGQTLVDPQSDVCLPLSGHVDGAVNATDSTVFFYGLPSCLGNPRMVVPPGQPAPLVPFPFSSLKFQGP
jgi:hypothetical protein